jgi:hypothetical protein
MSKFVPMTFPHGIGIISNELQSAFKEMLDVTTAKMDHSSLSHEKSIKWQFAFSQSCLCFSQKMTLLHHQLSSLEDRNELNVESCESLRFPSSRSMVTKCSVGWSLLKW